MLPCDDHVALFWCHPFTELCIPCSFSEEFAFEAPFQYAETFIWIVTAVALEADWYMENLRAITPCKVTYADCLWQHVVALHHRLNPVVQLASCRGELVLTLDHNNRQCVHANLVPSMCLSWTEAAVVADSWIYDPRYAGCATSHL